MAEQTFTERITALKEKVKHEFDGCTSAPDFNFVSCCDEHDYYYITKSIPRAEADKRLRVCIMKRGPKVLRWPLSWVYWGAVRLAGWYFWQRERNEPIQQKLLFPGQPSNSPPD